MPVIQNISIAAGDDLDVTFNLDDDTPIDLTAAQAVRWHIYDQEFGIPVGDALLVCSTQNGKVTVPGSPTDIFEAHLTSADTDGMLHNYYHEAFVQDVNGNKFTITVGILTVTPTKIASTL